MGKLLLGLLFVAPLAFPSGPFAIGVKGGLPLTDNFKTGSVANPNLRFTFDTKRYTVGPTVELRLPFGLGFEADALYRRLDYSATGNQVDVIVHEATTANSWDFPLLLKWRFLPGPIRPYASVGPTFRYVSSVNQVKNFFVVPTQVSSEQSTSNPPELANRFSTGLTIAGGLQLGSHIAPEIRYIRWGWTNFSSPSTAFKNNQNEVLFLLGLTF